MVPEAKTNRHRTWPSSTGFRRRTASAGVTRRPSMEASHKGFSMGRGTRRHFMGQSNPWPTADSGQRAAHPRHARLQKSRPNRIKASLSAFQRREVKVLGFDVKTRLRPQRMDSRGCSDPFALVGTIGKACGEAWVCVFSGSPPGCWCVLPLSGWCVGCVGVLTSLMF